MNVWVKKESDQYIFSLIELEDATKCEYVGSGNINSHSEFYIIISKEESIYPFCFTNKKIAKSKCKGTLETAKKVSQTKKEKENKEDEENECIICVEPCSIPLSCGHFVHELCVAKSGKSECCICKKEVKLEISLEEICQQKSQERKEEIKKQEEEESIRLARELQQERVTRITINNFTCNVTLMPEKEWISDEFTVEICRVMHEIYSKKTRIKTYNSIIQTIPLIYQINSISMATNLSVNDICNCISLVSN